MPYKWKVPQISVGKANRGYAGEDDVLLAARWKSSHQSL